ncbi:MAG: Gfo/Idh/MocA family oxidoreductase [Pseudomonadota bacterium]
MIRIGLLGASRISREAVIAPAARIGGVEISCVAARDPARAKAFADEHGIPRVERDYAALLRSDAVDLVYNGLPPSEHMQWSIAALRAAKAVLCEKPFALNAGQARLMVEAAAQNGGILIEAFHYRFHPLFGRVLDVLRSGEIGAIRSLGGRFNVAIPFRRGELRYDSCLGGGAMMDLGCYPVHWVRTVMGEEPVVVSATRELHPSGVDTATSAELEFSGGVCARISCSMDERLPNRLDAELVVSGDRGRLTVVNPLAPHVGHELIVDSAAGTRRQVVNGHSTYYHQLEHVVGVVNGERRQITGGPDAIANMSVIDAVRDLSAAP